MTTDTTTTLCTWAQFTQGAFADLARNVTDPAYQNDLLMEATRLCEAAATRRLAPFTTTESHRLQGVDPDEYGDVSSLPLDQAGAIGLSYAQALGSSSLVRHCWLNEYAPHYPEMWTYSNISVTVARSFGGTQVLSPGQYMGPERDSGHIWFNLGLFIPIGSYADIAYTGGYTTTPADLRRASKLMIAAVLVRELLPRDGTRDPDMLVDEAEKICVRYARD